MHGLESWKGVDERNDKSVLRWFGHIERIGNRRIPKRLYVCKYIASLSVGRKRKRWIGSENETLKKRFGGWAYMESGAS